MKNNIDVDRVTQLLKTKTLKECAVHIGVPYGSLYGFCKSRRIDAPVKSKMGRKSKSEEHAYDIVKMYLEGMSQDEIAKKVGFSTPIIAKIIKNSSNRMRTISEAARLRDQKKTPEQLKQQASAANAVRHAMAIINRFSW